MLRNFIILFLFFLLNNCVSNGTALLGPSFTVAKTGNIYQAGLSYGSGQIINEAKKGLKKIKRTQEFAYKRLDRVKENIKYEKIALEKKANLFFKAAENNFKRYN